MSTRCSIGTFPNIGHLWWEGLTEPEQEGLYLAMQVGGEDLPMGTARRGELSIEYRTAEGVFGKAKVETPAEWADIELRIPWDICEAIAKFVNESKSFATKLQTPPSGESVKP